MQKKTNLLQKQLQQLVSGETTVGITPLICKTRCNSIEEKP